MVRGLHTGSVVHVRCSRKRDLAQKPHSSISVYVSLGLSYLPGIPQEFCFFKKDCNAGLGWLMPAEPTAMNKLVMAGLQGDSRVDPRPMPCWVSGRPVKMVLVGGVGKGLNTETLVASLQLAEAIQFSLSLYDSRI